MGILNVTPDSFYDGGNFDDENKALDHAKKMSAHGADIIDVGGESTRPGSVPISLEEEIKRVLPVVKALAEEGSVVSIDTRRSNVMRKALDGGAKIINDISALTQDVCSLKIAAASKASVVLMHMKGRPYSMDNNGDYIDVVEEVNEYLGSRIMACQGAGIEKHRIFIDPGIGFGKNLEHNLRLISKISTFHSLGCPILVGASRKRFIEHIVTKFDTPDRTGGTLASVLYGLSQGVQLFRVHNVKEINQGILVFNKILNTN